MKLIVISTHAKYEGGQTEQELVSKMFDAGLTRFHLRKPTYSVTKMRDWLDAIDSRYHNRIIVHSFHDLALEYDLRGVHLTDSHLKNNKVSAKQIDYLFEQRPQLQLSASFHTLDEVRFAPKKYDYVFLSPIYDSISKQYNAAPFTKDEIRETVKYARNNVVALGGIRADKIEEVRTLGFDGIAVLGAVWKSIDPLKSFEEVYAACPQTQDMCLP